jgi:hypothetical protein
MKKFTIIMLAVAAVVVVLLVAAWRLLGTVIAPKVEQRIAQIGLTSNEVAANGPLPGDVSLYAQELACSQALPTPGKAIWRTYFENANASGKWLNAVNLNIMANGQIAFA